MDERIFQEMMREIEEKNMKEFGEVTEGVFDLPFAEKLRKMGYFKAPAAHHHHGAEPGGLYKHSLQVPWNWQI